jgi:hypothetical protein
MNKDGRPPKPQDRDGYVYVLRCDEHYVKIGRVGGSLGAAATRLVQRLSSIRVGNPHLVELLAYVYVTNAWDWELALHEQFKKRRHRGEWFKFTTADYDALHAALEARSDRACRHANGGRIACREGVGAAAPHGVVSGPGRGQ